MIGEDIFLEVRGLEPEADDLPLYGVWVENGRGFTSRPQGIFMAWI
jgi:hypothetical protein